MKSKIYNEEFKNKVIIYVMERETKFVYRYKICITYGKKR